MARKSQFPPSVNPGIPKEQNPPKGWKLPQFGEVFRIVERAAHIQDEDEYQLVIAKRNREGIVPREKLLGKKILTKSQYYLRSGDFLISRRQIVHGACGIVPEFLDGAIVSNEYSTLLPTNDLLLEYLSYYSHTIHFQQTCFHSSIGVDVEKMVFKIEDWLHHKMPLPSISEQQKICAILRSVDNAIQIVQNIIYQTQRIKQGLLQQLLSRGIGHTNFKKSKIGEIPEKWELKNLEEIALIILGQSPPSSACNVQSKGYPFYQGNADFGYRCPSPKSWIENPPKIAKKDDILISVRAPVGELNLANTDCCIGRGLGAIRPLSANRDFIYYALLNARKQLASISQGSTFDAVNGKEIRNLSLLIPKLSEQEKVANILNSLDDAIQSNQSKMIQLQKIKRFLIEDLLTGRVRVKVNEE
jgi:type I restriction enzyme, S subunit